MVLQDHPLRRGGPKSGEVQKLGLGSNAFRVEISFLGTLRINYAPKNRKFCFRDYLETNGPAG